MIKKVLFLGNIPTEDERSIGGATVLAKSILTFLQNNKTVDVEHLQIRTHWKRYYQLFDYIILSIKAPFVFFKFDVISIHATNDFHFTVAPIIWIWAKLFRKRIIYHSFGGVFYDLYKNKSKLLRFIIRNTILKSDAIFLETKYLVESFKNIGIKNCIWLPNAREQKLKKYPNNEFKKRFVFISRITRDKGIGEILLASEKLTTDYVVDLYGPIDNEFYSKDSFKNTKVRYRGVLKSNEVTPVLKSYDVLLLPTYYSGEGYPGIIIESLSLAIPVITTAWKSIPEIIENHKNGLLIKHRSADELKTAILHFNQENYKAYSKAAYESFNKFNQKTVFEKLIKQYIV